VADANGYKSWDEALVEALMIANGVPLEHNIHDVTFGTFAKSVGGGHYVSMVASYPLGNTKRAPRGSSADVLRVRTALVTAAWRRQALGGSDG
jgi:hypothetical protein